MKRLIALVSALGLVFLLGMTALAHAEIENCTPAIEGTVDQAPGKLVCKASEGMDPKGSKLSVFDASGKEVDKGDSQVDLNDPDRVTIAVSLDAAALKDGVYTVKWVTVSAADGDSADGQFTFSVAANAAPATSAPTAGATAAATESTSVPTAGITAGATTSATAEATIATATATATTTAIATAIPETTEATTAATTEVTSTPAAPPETTLPATGQALPDTPLVVLAALGMLILVLGVRVRLR